MKTTARDSLLILVIATLSVSLLLSGCGYTTRSMIADKYKTIYVKPVVNKIDITREADAALKYKIYRPLLDTEVTKAIVDRYLFDGNLKPVSLEDADLILESELIDFRKEPLRYTEDDEVEEYRVNVMVNMSLYDNKKRETVWQEKGFTGSQTYFTTGPNVKSEDAATNEAIADLARRIVERTIEEW